MLTAIGIIGGIVILALAVLGGLLLWICCTNKATDSWAPHPTYEDHIDPK